MADVRSRLFTVRGRSALIAAAVVTVALVGGAVVMLGAFERSLERNLDQTLLQQAQDRARLLDQGTDTTAITDVLQEEALVWIGTPSGEVVATGGAVVPLENPVPEVLDGNSTTTLRVEERKPDEIESERMTMRVGSATTADGELVVLAGAEQEVIDQTVGELARFFVLGIPVLVLVVAVSAWFTTGRALVPVERIRRRTSTISSSNLSDRVPVPGGHDEIHALAETMNEMLDRLESSQDSLRQFTADASHELKSPVANLRVLVDTADVDDPRWADLAGRMRMETERLRDLVDNLLFLASHADGSAPVAPRGSVHLDDLVFDEVEMLSATSDIRVDVGGMQPSTISGDEGDLRRLVRNLVDNAVRHAGAVVRFSTRADEEAVVLEIADDGPGIDPAHRERVFERFTRLDDARDRDGGGTGLGLAIVRRIVDDHGASIALDEAPEGGALVVVTFPSAASEQAPVRG